MGPRNATDLTVAAPVSSAVTVTDSGRTIAVPAPEAIDPVNVGSSEPKKLARPDETCAGT
jgi:hypothetical protein